MRVLVTGGAGFIGSHVVDRLLECNNEVVVLDNLSNGNPSNLANSKGNPKLDFRVGDVRDEKIVNDCAHAIHAIIHLAALTRSTGHDQGSNELADVNVRGTTNLLHAARRNDVQRFILASSAAVYGNCQRFPLREGFHTSVFSPYGASKIASEQYCHSFREKYEVNTTSLRFFNVYGPRQLQNGDGAVIPHFMNRLIKGLPPEIFGDGEQTRDFVHVNDVVECIVRVLQVKTDEEVFNVGSGKSVTINRLALLMMKIFGISARPIYKTSLHNEIRNSRASTRKISKSLGFRPSIVLEEGLNQLAQNRNTSELFREQLA